MRRRILLAALTALAALALVTGDATALTALPVLGLFALLLSGTYVGERAYVRRLTGRRPTPRRRAPVVAVRSRVVVRPCGASLLGACRGWRGPPALLPAA